jgi:hypothetical protein
MMVRTLGDITYSTGDLWSMTPAPPPGYMLDATGAIVPIPKQEDTGMSSGMFLLLAGAALLAWWWFYGRSQ